MDNDAKLRPFYLAKILYEHTDEEHSLNTPQLQKILEDEYGMSVHRQTIPSDMELLANVGLDINVLKSNQNRYRLLSRELDIAELKLILDAVAASKFISKSKCSIISKKLAGLASIYQAESLKRNISPEGRVRTTNEKTFLIIDAINTGINEKKKIAFKYFTYTPKKKKELKHDGQDLVLSPYGLVWNDNFYYVLGWSDLHGEIRTFRVDRIYDQPQVLEESAAPKPRGFSVDKYADTAFGMYNGELKKVTLVCRNDLMDYVIDKFGEKVKTTIHDNEHFTANVEVKNSRVFFSWVFGFCGGIKIAGPEDVKREYEEMVRKQCRRLYYNNCDE